MKKVIIKCDENSGFLRTEAVARAIEFEETYMANKNEGSNNGVLWMKTGTQNQWSIYVYHTKTSIIACVDMLPNNMEIIT